MRVRWPPAAAARGIVGYNVQSAVDVKHHLIVAHEVINVGHDQTQLASMAKQARAAVDQTSLTVVADRGYFKGEEILECEQAGIRALVPKPLTSNNRPRGASIRQILSTSRNTMNTVPGRPTGAAALHGGREGADAAQVLVLGLPAMSDQGAMHHRHPSTDHALGAREGTGGDAGSTGPHARGFAFTAADGRASVRNA